MANENIQNQETRSINTALAKNLGAYASIVPNAAQDSSDKKEKLAQIDFKNNFNSYSTDEGLFCCGTVDILLCYLVKI